MACPVPDQASIANTGPSHERLSREVHDVHASGKNATDERRALEPSSLLGDRHRVRDGSSGLVRALAVATSNHYRDLRRRLSFDPAKNRTTVAQIATRPQETPIAG
jgi:ribulose bisphosphate carboxylase small subunit